MSFWDSFNQMYETTKNAKTERAVRKESEAIRGAELKDISTPDKQTSFGPTGLGMTHTSPGQKGYEFLGQRFDQRPDEYQQHYAKQMAMGDLYEKHGLFDRADSARTRAMQARQYQDDLRFRTNDDTRAGQAHVSNMQDAALGRQRTDQEIIALAASNRYNELTEAERIREGVLRNDQLRATTANTQAATRALDDQARLFGDTYGAQVGMVNEQYRGLKDTNDFNSLYRPYQLQQADAGVGLTLAQTDNVNASTEAQNFNNWLNEATKNAQVAAPNLANDQARANIGLTTVNTTATKDANSRANAIAPLEQELAKLQIDWQKMDVDQRQQVVSVNEQYQAAIGGDPEATLALVMQAAPVFNQHGKTRIQTNPDGEPVIVNADTGEVQYVREALKTMSPASQAQLLARAQQYALLAVDGDVSRFNALVNAEASDFEMGLRAQPTGGSDGKPPIEYLNTTVQRYQQQLATISGTLNDARNLNLSEEQIAQLQEQYNEVLRNMQTINQQINDYYGVAPKGNPTGRIPREAQGAQGGSVPVDQGLSYGTPSTNAADKHASARSLYGAIPNPGVDALKFLWGKATDNAAASRERNAEYLERLLHGSNGGLQ